MLLRLLFWGALILTAASAQVQAQNPQPAAPDNPTVPVAPPNSASPPPERVAPSAGGTLSNQLSRQRGTVSPPNVDPGMAIQPSPSQRGTMPVIPPPGSPGGNSSVVPK